jgi:hypothetical protein
MNCVTNILNKLSEKKKKKKHAKNIQVFMANSASKWLIFSINIYKISHKIAPPCIITLYTNIQDRLPLVLHRAQVFEKKGMDSSQYNITFRLEDKAPKQAGIFGDCGVWVCIFLYRLSHGISLHVDDPVDVAIAYREKMVRFYYFHRYYPL